MTQKPALPDGLIYHCDQCSLVVPADAPDPGGADCAFVALHRLAWFDPTETIAGQHCMAVAAWLLIHHAVLQAGDPQAAEYKRQFQRERRHHFAQSAARKAMTPEQVQASQQAAVQPHSMTAAQRKTAMRQSRDHSLFQ